MWVLLLLQYEYKYDDKYEPKYHEKEYYPDNEYKKDYYGKGSKVRTAAAAAVNCAHMPIAAGH